MSKLGRNAKKLLVLVLVVCCTVWSTPNVFAQSVTVQQESVKAKKKTVRISLNKTSVELREGKTVQLRVKGTTRKVAWGSKNTKVAKVNRYGLVTAKKAGTTKITATVLGKTITCKVTVKKKEIPLRSIELNWEELDLETGEQDYLEVVKFVPSNTTVKKNLRWWSDDDEIVEVDDDGNIYAGEEPGTTTIYVKVVGTNIKASCEVYVSEPEEDWDDDDEDDWDDWDDEDEDDEDDWYDWDDEDEDDEYWYDDDDDDEDNEYWYNDDEDDDDDDEDDEDEDDEDEDDEDDWYDWSDEDDISGNWYLVN